MTLHSLLLLSLLRDSSFTRKCCVIYCSITNNVVSRRDASQAKISCQQRQQQLKMWIDSFVCVTFEGGVEGLSIEFIWFFIDVGLFLWNQFQRMTRLTLSAIALSLSHSQQQLDDQSSPFTLSHSFQVEISSTTSTAKGWRT
jgi:hypothetical protein